MTTTPLTLAFDDSAALNRSGLEADVATRRRRLTEAMKAQGIDALLLASEENVTYTTGYETTFWVNKSKPYATILSASGETTVICHVGEAVSSELDGIDLTVKSYYGPDRVEDALNFRLDYQVAAVDAIAQALAAGGHLRIGAELGWHFIPGFSSFALELLREKLAPAELVDGSSAIWSVRRIKSDWEVERMRQSAVRLGKAHERFAENVRIGMTERDISRLLRVYGVEQGGEKIPYTGVMAGVNRAPLGGPTDRKLEAGQVLGVDLCLQISGYWSDFCRIYATAEPTAQQLDAYARLVDALQATRAMLKAGTTVSEMAKSLLVSPDSPYARAGHGLGLGMPEPPSVALPDDTPLLPGEVICLEPNIEVEGVGRLTAEEEILITEDGCELLGPEFPTELRVVGS